MFEIYIYDSNAHLYTAFMPCVPRVGEHLIHSGTDLIVDKITYDTKSITIYVRIENEIKKSKESNARAEQSQESGKKNKETGGSCGSGNKTSEEDFRKGIYTKGQLIAARIIVAMLCIGFVGFIAYMAFSPTKPIVCPACPERKIQIQIVPETKPPVSPDLEEDLLPPKQNKEIYL